MKVEKLATAIGRSWRAVVRYENGASQPPVGVAAGIAETLGVPLDALLIAC